MARARNGKDETVHLQVDATVLDVGVDEQPPPLAAYAFSSSGRLLGRADVKEAGAPLSFESGPEPDQIRLLVGPRIDSDDEGKLLSDLIRVRAAERMLRAEDFASKVALPIDRAIWPCWLRRCTARGTLLKRVFSGGVSIDLPVCDAEIEVYEVDPVPIVISRIPDWMLERLRDVIRIPRPPWPPWPPEDGLPTPPGPGPDPAPFLDLGQLSETPAFRVERALAPHGEAELDAESERLFRFAGEEHTLVSRAEASAALQAIAEEPAFVRAASIGVQALRNTLIARTDLARPLLCFIWPPAVTTHLVATTTTDDCGHFRTTFWPGCSSDVPDLYFKAYRRIGFLRFPIYTPTPIACHTWWNYACGTEVTLHTTSPFAHTCPPCPPVIAPRHWVLAMAVGNTSLAAIRGTGSDLDATTDSSNIGLTSSGAPFGGTLHFRFEFDNTLRPDLNVRYYRLRWRNVASGNPFLDIETDEFRHYGHWVGSTFQIEPYKLGGQPVGSTAHLYEIPPALPPVGQWLIADAVVDTSSSTFLSASFAPPAGAGMYEFELTLFDGAGVQVNANTLGISYRIPKTTDLTSTIDTNDAAALGLVTVGGALVFQLHIDNNVCSAHIDAPVLDGVPAGDDCGVLRYSDTSHTVSIGWEASHPHGFARYDFGVTRGANPRLSSSGAVGAPPGAHTLTPSVAFLLESCTVAGFAEVLNVHATATDGWSTQTQYDASAVRAFVLAPPEPS